MIAFTFSGFWESRRNRIDLLITVLGLFWIVTHFIMALPASAVRGQIGLKKYTYTFGYMVVILRFFTIAGIFSGSYRTFFISSNLHFGY